MDHLHKEAIIDKSKKYRYSLSRIWNPKGKNFVHFVMLNPSTADHKIDDPTIKRCIKIAQSLEHDWEKYDGMYITNLFAYRSTDPKKLYDKVLDVVWPDNNNFILNHAKKSKCSILARWNHGKIMKRHDEVIKLLEGFKTYCFWKNKSGHPKHPLYVRKDSKLIKF